MDSLTQSHMNGMMELLLEHSGIASACVALHCCISKFCSLCCSFVLFSNIAFLFTTLGNMLCDLEVGASVLEEHTISIFRPEDGSIIYAPPKRWYLLTSHPEDRC
jgi:hypothetical protein